MTVGAREMLASRPEVTIVYTRDDAVLKGRDARWFPRVDTIAMHGDLRGLSWRCAIMHELGHVVLGHPAGCDNAFYDQRNEMAADEFAARHLLPDLDAIGREIATTTTHGHAARNLGVILDLLEVRLKTLDEDEHRQIDRIVYAIQEGRGC